MEKGENYFAEWKDYFRKWKESELSKVGNFNARKIFDWQEMQKAAVNAFNQEKGTLDPGLYDCPKCLNRGSIAFFDERHGNMAIKYCECLNIREGMKLMEDSGCASLVKKCRLANFHTEDPSSVAMKRKALEWLNLKEKTWFYIGGGVGTGKTHLAAALANVLTTEGRPVKFMNWAEEAMGFRPGYGSEKLTLFKTSQILVIDDFLRGTPDETSKKLAYGFVNYRYSEDLCTIFTSERDLRELFILDEAIASRIKEKCGNYIISVHKKNERMGL